MDDRSAGDGPERSSGENPLTVEARMLLRGIREQMFGTGEPLMIGRFALVSLLGRGAHGSVYLATDSALGRRVALKLLGAREDATGARTRLEREAHALARLNHPNVLTIHDVGVADERVFIAMEYVEDGTLARWCGQHPPGTRERFAVVHELAIGIARGLVAAHDAGIVHRDVKPANILVGADGRPRLADFGLARAMAGDSIGALAPSFPRKQHVDVTVTRTGDLLGTPAYMAPEQFGGHVDMRSDQFSFCTTLWEVSYGIRPVSGNEPGAPWSPAGRREIPAWWREVLLRGLARDPDRRWPSMAELLGELERRRDRNRTIPRRGAKVVATARDTPVVASKARRSGTHANAVTVIEAAYSGVDQPEASWLEGLVDAALLDMGDDFGVCAYSYDARATPMRIMALVAKAGPPTVAEIVRSVVEQSSVDPAYVDSTWRAHSFVTVSETIDLQSYPPARVFTDLGMNDILVVNAYDPSGLGVWLGAPLSRAREPTAPERRVWPLVSSHISAALRLRFRLAAQPRREPADLTARAAAILTTDGKLEHADATTSSKQLRERLRDAVRCIERARGPTRRRDPEAALDLWRVLVEARFTLLDAFQSGGRRYILAVENMPRVAGPAVLTPRERQVLAAAATGRPNKLIAYELGLSASTIRVLLARAARKLQLETRRELVALYRSYAQVNAGEGEPD
jgi:DNA-binding CsgD family transcriptional regulator